MPKKTNLKWRLGKLPSAEEVIMLLEKKLISQDEAKDILFSSETEEDRDKKSLESEIKFLRELVHKLSTKAQIVEQIRHIEKPYYHWGWYQPYQGWCSSSLGTTASAGTLTVSSNGDADIYNASLAGSGLADYTSAMQSLNEADDFTLIKTF